MKKRFALALLAGLGLSCSTAMAQYSFPSFNMPAPVGQIFNAVQLDVAPATNGTYTTYTVNIAWTGSGTAPFDSRGTEARFALTDRAVVDGTTIPTEAVTYIAPGAAPGAADNSSAQNLGWSGTLAISYAKNAGNPPLYFICRQDSFGEIATFNNVRITLGGVTAPPGFPTNDNCSAAVAIGALPFLSPAIDISLASNADTGDPIFSCGTVRRTIWYTFTPTVTGSYTFQTCTGSAPATTVVNTAIGVFSGDCATGTYTQLACNTNGCGTRSTVTTNLTAGQTFFVVIGRVGTDDPVPPSESALSFRVNFNPPGPVPPTNDDCFNATSIDPVTLPVITDPVDVLNATSVGEPTFCATTNRTVWYSFVPTQDGIYRFSSCAGDIGTIPNAVADTIIAVFSGDCSSLTSVGCNADGGAACSGARASVDVLLTAGTQYRIMLGRQGTTTPTGVQAVAMRVSLQGPPPTPPANDECTAAIVLNTEPGFGLPYTTTPVNIFDATVSSDPATCVASTNTIWYSFTPTATDYFQFSTCAADAPATTVANTTISVFESTGTCGDLTLRACNDDGGVGCTGTRASVALFLNAGTRYYIQVGAGAAPTVTGLVALNIKTIAPPPAAATCDGAIVMPSSFTTWTSDPIDVSSAPNAQSIATCAGTSVTRQIYYKFTPAVSGNYLFSTCQEDVPAATLLDTVISIYRPSDPANVCPTLGTFQACNDDATTTGLPAGTNAFVCTNTTLTDLRSNFRTQLEAGVTYIFVIGRYGTAQPLPAGQTILQFKVTAELPPANDTCAGAISVNTLPGFGIPFTVPAQSINFALAVGDPTVTCAAATKSVWYTFTPTVSTSYFLSTCPTEAPGTTAANTFISVYSGDCGTLLEAACSSNFCGTRGAVTVPMTAGTTYRIAIGTTGTTNGNISFRISDASPPASDTCAAAINLNAIPGFALPFVSSPVDLTFATTDGSDPTSCAASQSRTIFYRWTAQASGNYLLSTCTSDAPANTIAASFVSIFTGSCGSLTSVACASTSSCGRGRVTFTATAGTTYTFMIGRNALGALSGGEGTIAFNLRQLANPPTLSGETEPNDTKATANVFNLTNNTGITGTSTGTTTTGGALTTFDYFRINLPAGPGITRHRLALISSGTPQTGHTMTLRGLTQTATGIGTGETILTNAITQANPAAVDPVPTAQVYALGTSAATLLARVSGTAATTAPYQIALFSDPVTPIDVAGGSFPVGSLTIRTTGQTAADTELWVYDSNFNPIANFGNDNDGTSIQSRLTRTFAQGTYYLAIGEGNMANNLASPSDDGRRTSAVADFPGYIVSSASTTSANLNFVMDDGVNPARTTTFAKNAVQQIGFFKFTVGSTVVGCDNPADVANTDGDPVPDQSIDNGDFQAFFAAFFLAPGDPGQLVADIANTDGETRLEGAGPDGTVDNGDFQAFFLYFFQGCP
ncbi:MAG: GC-type dockerin domain-anchored protein [Phycisphaerales bacterium]|jgi:hypothetical protein|nr:hypothetical protein [Phycisphaeraceae bacterium]